MATLIEQLISKMGLHSEPKVLEKTTELIRLLELRSINVPLRMNAYGKVVICADLAAGVLGIPIDKEQALKLSGLRQSQYVNNKRLVEKLLDLYKIVGVSDICVKLGLSEITKKAEELLDLYKEVLTSEHGDIDISHPQYAAMACFQACKMVKKKATKTKFVPFSNLKPTQWQQLEHRWNEFIEKYQIDMENKLKKKQTEIADGDEAAVKSENSGSMENKKSNGTKAKAEDYEQWKKRMISLAESELRNMQEDQQNDKENFILG